MGSLYLRPRDYMLYGVEQDTSVSDVVAASGLIDTYLDRPEGLVYLPDIDGNPCYMKALTPARWFAAPAAFAAASNVVINLPANMSLNNPIGESVIIDRDTALMENCRIISATQTSVTLARTVRPHSAGCKIEFGLVPTETKNLPSKRSNTRISHGPIVRLVSGVGKYEYGRRSDQSAGVFQDANLLATIQTFGGPPPWNSFDPSQCDINSGTGEVWIPAGMLIAYYSQVRLWYVCGFLDDNVPSVIRSVCAELIRGRASLPDELSGGIQSLKAGDTQITRFRDTFLNEESKRLLKPYKVQALY